MSSSAKNDSDHSLNTLTDVVRLLGDSRKDVKQVQEHQSEHDHRFDQLECKVDANQQESRKRFDQQDRRLDKIEEMLSAILSRLPTK
ncbi:hypothetical protein [Endozoicomonas euniceicola]|uniref:DUF904 domain-containing protein n=1 Tax=Endozoicomonas euniceicola TaxID=1234143 RepID=A0ABY6H1P2_9GAMM|nr:hypothetical protein [Endozoicomonas euniceicola]UYM18519.1 hypothetical protein NX720_11655 [Endozoicomonas euniceicola]